jgi:histidine triad (HIT) family protein
MSFDPSCIFCKIVRRESASEIIYESPRVMGILDIRPIHYGHALVIPKDHCRDFLSLQQEDLFDILDGSQRIAKALVESLGLDGFNIFSNNGRSAGQSVFHFHMHVVPRYSDDNIKFVLQLKRYAGTEMGIMAEKIRKAMMDTGSAAADITTL